jgi:anaerobic carbon-monoxide dehydrogenase catalytic subunit
MHPGGPGDGWGGSMIATDLQDVLFGCPYPLKSSANLGVLKEDHVNIVIHGHEPVLSEMIVVAAEPEMIDYAKRKGAKGIQLSGICCTANEILMRHGVPLAGNFLQQELAIVTGAVDAMVVDVQCIMQNMANVAKCFHTKIITTNPKAKILPGNEHIEFDEHTRLRGCQEDREDRDRQFPQPGKEVMIPNSSSPLVAGFSVRVRSTITWGAPSGDPTTPLNDNIINGRIRGIGGVVGCNNARTMHDEGHIRGQGTDQERRHRPHHRVQCHRLRQGRAS